MKTTLTLLRDQMLPLGFRLMIADLAMRGRRHSPLALAGAVAGWNAAMATGGTPHLPIHRPEMSRNLLTVALGTTHIFFHLEHGWKIRDEPQILHPQWREAIQRGEQIPEHEGEVFSPQPVTERLVPLAVEAPLRGDPKVMDEPGRSHPLENEVNVIGSGEHAAHATPEQSHASTLIPIP